MRAYVRVCRLSSYISCRFLARRMFYTYKQNECSVSPTECIHEDAPVMHISYQHSVYYLWYTDVHCVCLGHVHTEGNVWQIIFRYHMFRKTVCETLVVVSLNIVINQGDVTYCKLCNCV